jgi:sn-glycerol 3-phosphate transport system substrate-binding protein
MARRFITLLLVASFVMSVPLGMSLAQDGEITIDFYYPTQVGGSVTEIIEGYADAFHELYPDITVNSTYAGNYDQTYEAIRTEVAGGASGPHVAVLANTYTFSLIEAGLIIPAQDFIDKMEDGEAFINSFFPAYMWPDTDGVYWFVPFQRSTAILFYNKDMFAAAGLDPEQPPRHRLELLDYAQALNTDEVWGLEMPTDPWLFQSFTIASGRPCWDGDPAVVEFNSPEAIDALEFVVSLSQEHQVMPDGIISWGDASGDFIGGTVAMVYYSTGALTNILTNSNFEVGVAFLPSGLPGEDGTGYGTTAGGGNLYLFDRGTEAEREAAWKWAEFLSSPEIQADWGAQTGYVAANIDAWETDAMQSLLTENPAYDVAREQLAYAGPELTTYQYPDVSKILADALQSAITGEETPADALNKAQTLADSILEVYR